MLLSSNGPAPYRECNYGARSQWQTLTTDGPFAETHEQLGGFFIVNCNSLDEAIGWAARISHASYGSVEVRPLWEG